MNKKDNLLNSDMEFQENNGDYSDSEFCQKLADLYDVDERKKKEVYLKMKNKNRNKNRMLKVGALAAALVVALPFTNYGQEVIETIKELAIPSGRIQVAQEEVKADPLVPQGLKGKVFDKDGNELVEVTDEEVYDEKGNKVDFFELNEETGEWIVHLDKGEQPNDFANYDSIDKIAESLIFNPLVLEGDYELIFSDVIADEGEKAEYANFFYEDEKGREVIVFERVSTPENAYAMGSDSNIEEVEIDGVKAIYVENHSLEFERDGLLVGLQCKGANFGELVKMYKDLTFYN